MKIGIDIRLIGKQRTGDEVVFFNLTKELARIDSGHDFELLTNETDTSKLDTIAKRLEIENKKNFKIVPIKSRNRFLWNFWDLPKHLRRNPVDVYLTQYITPFFVSRKIKIITIVHDISFNFFPQFIKKSDLFFLKTLIPFSLRRADRILGVSEFTKNEIIDFYNIDENKVDFFYNAVSEDFRRQDVSEKKVEDVARKYNLPKNFILYIGTLQPRKNIPFLIESYASIKNKLGGTKLVIVGNRNAHNFDFNIDAKIKEFGLEKDIVFTGFVDEEDKAAIYKNALVFAFPSLYEGFGIPVLESFSMGIPVLASDIPSLQEVALEGARFADPGSIDKFSKELYDIIINKDIRNKLIALGKERVEFFSWKKTAKKVLGVFDSM